MTANKANKKKTTDNISGLTGVLNSDNLRTGQFLEASLLKLVESILGGLLNHNGDAEALLHVPSGLTGQISRNLSYQGRLTSTKLLLCRKNNSKKAELSLVNVADIPPKHPMRDELFLITGGSARGALIVARKETKNSVSGNSGTLWNSILSFNVSRYAPEVARIGDILDGSLKRVEDAVTWLSSYAEVVGQKSEKETDEVLWDDLLVDLIGQLENKYVESDRERNYFRLVNQIQEAVGWELDTGKLFESIAQSLKKEIGYDYLEIQVLEPKVKDFEVTAVHHRNDTNYGGQLLTVILRPEVRKNILKGRKPVLMNKENAADMLMNPKLMQYMSFTGGVIVPLTDKKRTNGLLKLFTQSENFFTEDDLKLMKHIGSILSKSILNVKSHSVMRRMATVDGLTNLYNRRFFNEQLMREFKRSRRYHSSLALIMIDVDHFKAYNDHSGHLNGDQVLIVVGELLKACVREVDFVARYGGEEFSVILPEANLKQGMVVAEKIRSSVEKTKFTDEHKQPSGKLTVSLGVATNTSEVDSINELINRADVALYRAKRDGRNQCIAFK